MQQAVARIAKGNEVLLSILARLTSKLLMVNLEIRHRAASLTTPAVATQHLLS